MLRSVKDLKGLAIGARDGDIGKAVDFIFDDKAWTIRYVVADTGGWLTDRRVLISPISIIQADWESKRLPVSLTKAQVTDCPDINSDDRFSRRDEMKYYDYYGWPYYWLGGSLWGPGIIPSELASAHRERESFLPEENEENIDQTYLRSVREVTDYYIQAEDGDVGHVEEFMIDDEAWVIRYMVVDTRNWWPGKKVLVAPEWIERVDWRNSKVYVDLSREQIKNGPEFDADRLNNRDCELTPYEHHGRAKYWS